jgi:hypothetical protein
MQQRQSYSPHKRYRSKPSAIKNLDLEGMMLPHSPKQSKKHSSQGSHRFMSQNYL